MFILFFSDSIFYTKYEAKEILENCSAILNFICQHNSNVTRYIIEKFEEFKPSLKFYVEKYRNDDGRDLFEAVESEEECLKESSRKLDATILIQSTFRMYRERCRWKKLKHGILMLQKLIRQRKERLNFKDNQQQEQEMFHKELTNLTSRRKEMERRYKLLAKLHPNRVNSFLGNNFVTFTQDTYMHKLQTI